MKNTDKQSWLDERKDLFVKNVLRDFINSYAFFLNIEKKFKEKGISYEGLDNWVGTQTDRGMLWILKDNCHRLWKDIDSGSQPEPFFFDWMVGAIFHEAMKLKENIYMADRYHPAFQVVSTATSAHSCRQFFKETLEDIQRGMSRLGELFMYAAEHLKSLLLTERDNSLLVRFMLENKSEIDKLWQKSGGLDQMLHTMFPEGLDEAYCMAGENYMEGSWYAEARMAFLEALKINPECKKAKSGLGILEKRLEELSHMLEMEYTLANSNQGLDQM
ncbi:MAG: tetratricopeptide repeat protein [Dissulfuribacterales bacterium]